MLRKALPLLIASYCISHPARAADALIHYQIPGQSLNNALIKFAVASNLEILFTADRVRGLQTAGISGVMSPAQALAGLLKNTGIRFRFLDSKTVTLLNGSDATPAAPNSTSATTPVISPQNTDKASIAKPKPAEPYRLPLMEVTADIEEDEAASTSYLITDTQSATKTSTPIKSIPQSIHVISKALSNDQQNVVMSESLANVSGVIARNALFIPVFEGTLIRGFSAEQLVDGFTQYYNPGDRDSTINNEKIEILKGSNATLYSGGSGAAVGGVVNVVSKLPKPKAFAEWSAKTGSYNFYQTALDINQPLHPQALFRITGEYTHANAHVDTVETQRYNINPGLILFDQSDTRITVQGKVSRWKQPDYQGLPAIGTVAGNFKIPVKTFIGSADMPDSYSKSDAVWGSLEHRLNSTWALNLKARYATAEFDEKDQVIFGVNSSIDRPLIPPSTWLLVNTELFQKQRELSFQGNATARFNTAISQHTLVFGGDHSELNDQGFIDFDTGIGTVDLSAPRFPSAYRKPGPGKVNSTVNNISYGGYAQLQSDIYKRLHLLTSLRAGHILTDYRNTSSAPASSLTESTRLLPRVGAVFDVSNSLSLFINYAEGMRGQPFQRFENTPRPEFSTQLEAGIKFDFFNQLSGQWAVYQIDRSNIAVASPTRPGFANAAGQQRSQGIEVDLLWQPSDSFSLLANYAHTDTRFMDNLAGVAAGNRVAKVPEHSARLWANYRFQNAFKGLSAGAGFYLQSDAYVSHDNLFKTAGFHTFDAAVAYETNRFKLAATVKNLTNERYFLPYDFLDGHVEPGAGTTAYGSVSVRF